jgi:hypothetical protein
MCPHPRVPVPRVHGERTHASMFHVERARRMSPEAVRSTCRTRCPRRTPSHGAPTAGRHFAAARGTPCGDNGHASAFHVEHACGTASREMLVTLLVPPPPAHPRQRGSSDVPPDAPRPAPRNPLIAPLQRGAMTPTLRVLRGPSATRADAPRRRRNAVSITVRMQVERRDRAAAFHVEQVPCTVTVKVHATARGGLLPQPCACAFHVEQAPCSGTVKWQGERSTQFVLTPPRIRASAVIGARPARQRGHARARYLARRAFTTSPQSPSTRHEFRVRRRARTSALHPRACWCSRLPRIRVPRGTWRSILNVD